MSTRAGILLSLTLSTLAACTRTDEAESVDDLRLRPQAVQADQVATQVTLTPSADIRHEGVRLVTVWDEGLRVLEYRERVQIDGKGKFSLTPIEQLTPVPPDWELRQISGAGFHFRYRDFAVQDKDVFAANYLLMDQEELVTVAGRSCARFLVERRDDSRRYDTLLDVETGLCLSYVEQDATGQTVSSMVYESIDTTPDLSGAIWHDPLGETSLTLEDAGRAELGFAVPLPTRVPDGYYLTETVKIHDGQRDWVKFTFTEGVETLFYLFSPRLTPVAAPSTGGSYLETVEIEPAPGELYVFDMGGATVVQGDLEEGLFLAVGKVSQQELVDLVEFHRPAR